ncbi:hypothetical protein J6590_044966 [Homalodisca vitripennis]|nr:hypothetical protein J6590_044966 [Homalodisca vitripennis]
MVKVGGRGRQLSRRIRAVISTHVLTNEVEAISEQASPVKGSKDDESDTIWQVRARTDITAFPPITARGKDFPHPREIYSEICS